MFGGSWNMSGSLGGLVGVAITSVVFLVTQEMTPTLTAVVVITGVVSLGLAILVARPAASQWSTLWFLVSAGITIPATYKAFKSFRPRPEPQFAQVELPGFSVALPDTEIKRFSTEYDFGWIDTRDREHELWTTVSWYPGTIEADADTAENAGEWLEVFDYDNPITVSENEIEFEWPGLDTRTYKLFIGLQRTDTTFVACGARLIAVMSWGPANARYDVERAHRRTVGTIECTPIADEEAFVDKGPPVRTTIPEGWEPRPDINRYLTIWSNGNATLLFQYFYRGHENLSDIRAMATDAIGRWGTVELHGSEKVGEIELWRGTLTDEEGEQTVLTYQTMCGKRPMLAVLFGWETIEEGRAALLAAHCD